MEGFFHINKCLNKQAKKHTAGYFIFISPILKKAIRGIIFYAGNIEITNLPMQNKIEDGVLG